MSEMVGKSLFRQRNEGYPRTWEDLVAIHDLVDILRTELSEEGCAKVMSHASISFGGRTMMEVLRQEGVLPLKTFLQVLFAYLGS